MKYHEETEVYASHQLQNSFLSTVDHLPCDIVRSLWLVQSCNIKIDKSKQELHNLLQKYQTTASISQDEINRMYELKHSIRHLYNETIQEGKTLNNQMIIHKLHLEDEINQLNTIKDKRVSKVDDKESHEQLRKQLKKHYKEHPLVSQVEAVVEQQKHSQKERKRASTKSGIKLVLRIPKQDKVLKPKGKHVVKKNSTERKTKTVDLAKKDDLPAKKERKPIRKEKEIVPQVKQVQEEEDEDNKRYCFCQQPSLGDMIACDNEASCPNGEWFHYKCVGLLNRVDALKYTTGKIPWYCSDTCRQMGESEKTRLQEMKKRKRRRKW
ncbi:hypothetical protein CANMA_004025 [Candida margitis]|uniref:uncharacterized protein n=1 Tax=Candida margitis TaxID=1775924 RepID=UPI002227AE59|nr:uncharacterized protein CANMA_004025 [Candida margitis]KAI5960245.1 hypothetical protein CANMA_004025 [Candida margitis]